MKEGLAPPSNFLPWGTRTVPSSLSPNPYSSPVGWRYSQLATPITAAQTSVGMLRRKRPDGDLTVFLNGGVTVFVANQLP